MALRKSNVRVGSNVVILRSLLFSLWESVGQDKIKRLWRVRHSLKRQRGEDLINGLQAHYEKVTIPASGIVKILVKTGQAHAVRSFR